MRMRIRIVFIGAGRMASAMVRGLLKQKHYHPHEIACTCGADLSGPQLAQQTGIQYFAQIIPAIRESDTLVLACKPQQLSEINATLVEAAQDKLILSILAGTPLSRLNAQFGQARNIVRTMPNTPGQIGAGVTAFAAQKNLSAADRQIVENTLGSLGKVHAVEEVDLDAVTALSGSGPAYIFEFAAALREAGIHCGLTETLAHSLTIDTLLGAALLLTESADDPESLRDAVTSPGGTTAAALKIFRDNDLRGLVGRALGAAKARSVELAKELQ